MSALYRVKLDLIRKKASLNGAKKKSRKSYKHECRELYTFESNVVLPSSTLKHCLIISSSFVPNSCSTSFMSVDFW